MLVVLLILGILGGVSALSRWAPISPEREADRAMCWLLRALTRSNRTGRSLALDARSASGKLTLRWKDSPVPETFPASPGFRFQVIRQGYARPESVYSPQWGTFTPAATIRVSSPQEGRPHYLILSGYGRVRTAPAPPPGGVE